MDIFSDPIIVILTAAAGALVSIAVKRLFRKLDTIHVLVNSRLSEALDKIDQLEETVRELNAKEHTDVEINIP